MLLFQHSRSYALVITIVLSQFKFSTSIDYPCICNANSCLYAWNAVMANQNCHDSRGWPIFICGAARGLDTSRPSGGIDKFVTLREIFCTWCLVSEPRTLIYPAVDGIFPQYECVSPTWYTEVRIATTYVCTADSCNVEDGMSSVNTPYIYIHCGNDRGFWYYSVGDFGTTIH